MRRRVISHDYVDNPTLIKVRRYRGLSRMLRRLLGMALERQEVVETRRTHSPECVRCFLERRAAQRRKR